MPERRDALRRAANDPPHQPEPSPPTDDSALPALLHEVLVGAGTTVWAWDAVSDRLSGIECSVHFLGYAPGAVRWTQVGWDSLLHPHDRLASDHAYERHVRGETPVYECEYRARAADGSWRWMSERGHIVSWAAPGEPQRVVGTLTDIGSRKRAEYRALELGERLAQLASHVPGMLYQYIGSTDGTGRFLYASEGCRALLGVSPAELMGSAALAVSLIGRRDRARLSASLRRSGETLQPWRETFRLYPRGQASRWVQVEATPRRSEAGDTGHDEVTWHGYLQDITERRALDLAREQAAAAAAANLAKTDFLSRVSHELRTPLNAVLGFAELMAADVHEPPTEGQRRRLRMIHDAGEHLLRMIGDLLDLTRVESGRMVVECGPVALLPLVQGCTEMLRPPHAGGLGVAICLPADDPGPPVWADAGRLRQVMLNLLSNATKYNRPGGWVAVRLLQAGARVGIEVADSGIGIPADQLPALFQPFNRLGRHAGPIEGTGIGLAVTRNLVELMGGSIEVRSQLDEGSVFTVWLPTAE
jgi:PAS domain S-box-containing protein